MKNKSLVSINDFTKDDYLKILNVAREFEKKSYKNLLNNQLMLIFPMN